MNRIIRVLQKAGPSARVQISDGRYVKVPLPLASWGEALPEESILEVRNSKGDISYCHSSFLASPPKPKPVLLRDFSGYDAKAELNLVKTCILKCYREILGHFWYSDHLEDLTLEIYLVLLERDCFRRWDSKLSSYQTYVQKAVRNYLIDIVRRSYKFSELWSVSLNRAWYPGSTEEFIDTLQDKINLDVTEELHGKALYECMEAKVMSLDKRENKDTQGKKAPPGTGVAGFTYKQIFTALLNKEDMDSFLSRYSMGKHDRKVLNKYVEELRHELRKVADSYLER